VTAKRSGFVAGMSTRDIGLAVVELGGGRRKATDVIDHRVGFSQFAQFGQQVQAGDILAVVHAADMAAAEHAQRTLLTQLLITETSVPPAAVMLQRVVASTGTT
jgi:thymidine phosphorylase